MSNEMLASTWLPMCVFQTVEKILLFVSGGFYFLDFYRHNHTQVKASIPVQPAYENHLNNQLFTEAMHFFALT
jgi:hypothetical protein